LHKNQGMGSGVHGAARFRATVRRTDGFECTAPERLGWRSSCLFPRRPDRRFTRVHRIRDEEVNVAPSSIRVRWLGSWGAKGAAVVATVLALATLVSAAPAFGPKEYVVKPALPLPVIERFPACQPQQGGQLRVENGPNGRSRVTLAVVVLNQRETVVMLEAPGQRRVVDQTVRLAADNTLLVWMIGPPGAGLSVSVTSAGACLDVAITSPPPGTSVPEGPLLVRGTVHAPVQAGVSVNGIPAMVHGNQWAAEISVDSTVTMLTATASVVAGASVTASTAIAVNPAGPPAVELVADPADGVAPLTVTWKVVNNTGRDLIQYELDPTGGGLFGPPMESFDAAQTTYSTAGLWLPTLRVVDDQGMTHTASTALVASDPATVSARFDALWGGLKSRLQAGDVTGALSFIAPALRDRMQQVFADLGPSLPAVAATLRDINVTGQLGDLAEAVIVQEESSGPQLYFIQFRRDGLGRWLIEEM
jgi:hypothetical protein